MADFIIIFTHSQSRLTLDGIVQLGYINVYAVRLLQVCKSDRQCGRGYFCDYHYGVCYVHSRLHEPCRRDGHCRRHHECVFGRCRIFIPRPEPGDYISYNQHVLIRRWINYMDIHEFMYCLELYIFIYFYFIHTSQIDICNCGMRISC